MNNEFKKTVGKNQTVYTLESASGGGTSSGSIASVSSPIGGVQRRGQIVTSGAEKKVPATTPRNFVAKNAKTGGAGAHTDKKRADKQGVVKHKKPFMESLADQLESIAQEDHSDVSGGYGQGAYNTYAGTRHGRGVAEEDHEIQMASSELQSIGKNAENLLHLVRKYSEEQGLEAWQQSKITKAADYLNSVLQSISGEQSDQGVAEAKQQQTYKVYIQDTDGSERLGNTFVAKSPAHARELAKKQGLKNITSVELKKGVAEGWDKLTPQQKAHEYNLDAAQREMDRRHAQGEDMKGAKIDKKTYKIVKPKQQGVAEGEKTMSRAAKGYEKYGKDGMRALAKAGREGASEKKLDAIRDRHDNYNEEWSKKYKSSINCSHPKGFSQKAHCAGKNKHNEDVTMESTCPDCGMCETHGSLDEIKKGQKDSNGYTKCWPGKHADGTKKSSVTGKQVRNCVPNEGVAEGSEQDDPYKGTTPGSGKVSARNGHRLGKTYKNPHSPKYHKDSYAKWDRDYNNETSRLKKQGVAEGMGEVHQIIGELMDRYIDMYRQGKLDGDHLMHLITKSAEILSKQFDIDQNQAQQMISNYVEDKVGNEQSDKYTESLYSRLDSLVAERSVSQSQHNLMVAVAHNPAFAKQVKVKPQVGQEFAQADVGHDISKLPVRVPKKK